MRELKSNPQFCMLRYLDRINKKGGKKDWYHPNIFDELAKHYKSKNQQD